MQTQFYQDIVIPPNGGLYTCTSGAACLTIQGCTLPLNIAFDGGPYGSQGATAGAGFPDQNFRSFTLQNTNTVAVTVTFAIGDSVIPYEPASNAVSLAATYSFGNLGQAAGAPAIATLPACNANGRLVIAAAVNYPVVGLNGQQSRQIIIVTCDAASGNPLLILDAAGNVFMPVAIGSSVSIVTDASFQLAGDGGAALATVGEIYLTATA